MEINNYSEWEPVTLLEKMKDKNTAEALREKLREIAKNHGTYELSWLVAVLHFIYRDRESKITSMPGLNGTYNLVGGIGAAFTGATGNDVSTINIGEVKKTAEKIVDRNPTCRKDWGICDYINYKLNEGYIINQNGLSTQSEDQLNKLLTIFGWKNINNSVGNSMNENKGIFMKIIEMIDNGSYQIIFTGAPGTGKTYSAKKIAEHYLDEDNATFDGKNYKFVQFHPSYDYTDFVEGIRPVDTAGSSDKIEFARIDGIFKAFCRKVVEENNLYVGIEEYPLYFFLIDEINRADLSKVFGELMYCLEKDKRGEANAVDTQYQNLKTYDPHNCKYLKKEEDVFSDGFYIPENVVILGTMNDIDRSVESMDFALRRRFDWVEFLVDEDTLTNAFGVDDEGIAVFGRIIKNKANDLAKSVVDMNEVIEQQGKNYGLNRYYFISQGQFSNLPDHISNEGDVQTLKEYVWEHRLESLLREYLRGEDEGDVNSFIGACRNKFIKKEPDNSEESIASEDIQSDDIDEGE